ncbi:MAG: MFS transporter [Magnetococcales bacterium]|nr:MFS transporter [Magnetococcales bacterium]
MFNQFKQQDKKNIFILAVCQGLATSDKSIMILLSGLVGVVLAEDKSLATLPVTTTWLGTLIMTVPASYVMKWTGRKLGFQIGSLLSFLGALLASYAIWESSFTLLLVGTFVSGLNGGFAQFFRFAAADSVVKSFKPHAISLVLTGGVLAALIGPKLAYWTIDMYSVAFIGAYLTQAVMAVLSFVMLLFLKIPRPSQEEIYGYTRPLSAIIKQPIFIISLLASVMAYGIMSLIMTATPLAMQGCGFGLSDSTMVIQWHMLAMFVPSFFTGSIIKQFGTIRVIQTGLVLLAACSVVALIGQLVHHFFISLFILGLGWNFAFVGGSTLLTDSYEPAEKAKVQAFNDLFVISCVAFSSALSGGLLYKLGWDSLHWLAIPLSLFSMMTIYILSKNYIQVVGSTQKI